MSLKYSCMLSRDQVGSLNVDASVSKSVFVSAMRLIIALCICVSIELMKVKVSLIAVPNVFTVEPPMPWERGYLVRPLVREPPYFWSHLPCIILLKPEIRRIFVKGIVQLHLRIYVDQRKRHLFFGEARDSEPSVARVKYKGIVEFMF